MAENVRAMRIKHVSRSAIDMSAITLEDAQRGTDLLHDRKTGVLEQLVSRV